MTINEVSTEISKRINERYKIVYTDSLIKTYLIKAMGVVFKSDAIIPAEDCFGLINTVNVSGDYDFEMPIRSIDAVFGSSGDIVYYPKTMAQIASIIGQPHLQPREGEIFYYMVGSKIVFYKPHNIDPNINVVVTRSPFETENDLSEYYSDFFVELCIREAIRTIITEVGGINDSK